MPMETQRHVLQVMLLIEQLTRYFKERTDVFVGGNMFVYFSPEQVLTHDFRGPDFFVAIGVAKRERKSWVTWWEGKGPDVVVELLSDSTARIDKGEKMEIYRDRLRVPECFWYHPFTGELAGFALRVGDYEPIVADDAGRPASRKLGLTLVRWQGEYQDVSARWLRWATPDGVVLPTQAEIAEDEHRAAEQERQVAEQERQRAEQLARRVAELEALLDRGADESSAPAE
ncbi:MAG: Uma2 family endonuclease [Chloroflexi bacterium]|nr:Uma2 family endonuclease [Chloroflexota bacterium]